jgi:hypothetical protein
MINFYFCEQTDKQFLYPVFLNLRTSDLHQFVIILMDEQWMGIITVQ